MDAYFDLRQQNLCNGLSSIHEAKMCLELKSQFCFISETKEGNGSCVLIYKLKDRQESLVRDKYARISWEVVL